MSDSRDEKKHAKANAAAENAKAKALRPWFKKKRFIIPMALVLLVGISQAVNGGGSSKDGSSNSSSQPDENQGETESMIGIGSKAVDGKFEFTVTKVKCGISSVGEEYLNAEAQGQFCRITLSIANIGDEPQTMFADNQDLYDTKGRKFSADTSAMIYDGGSDSWLKEINPGNALTGNLIFDVPADAALDYIELHDDAFSAGVQVSLK